MYWQIEKIFDGLNKKVIKSHYRGKETRTQNRISYLKSKNRYFDEMRFAIMAKYLENVDTGGSDFELFG